MSRRSIAVLALALLALLLGCWLWFGHAPQRSALPGVEPGETRGDPGSSNVSTPPTEESRSAAQPASDEKRFRPDSTRVEGRHELLVQRRDNGEPLAEVEVVSLELSNSDWSIGGTRGPLLTTDLEGYLAERGKKQLTDAQGIALVPEPDQTLVVCARKGELWGWTRFERGASEPAVLELGQEHDLEVLVRGADGTPQAGARVQVARLEDPSAFWSGATGADGALRVRNIEALLADQGLAPGELMRIALLEPFESPIERWIEPRALPAGPIELVLPACGSLRVRVVGKPGLPLPVDGELHVRWTARPAAVQALFPRRETSIVLPLVDGQGRVPHMALGGRLAVAAMFAGGCHVERELEGPRFAGEELTLELEIDSQNCLLVLPILDEQGQPLASRELEFARYQLPPDRAQLYFTSRERTRTDAQGMLHCVLPREPMIDTRDEPSERIGWLWLARAGQPTLAAEVDLRGPFDPGLNERPPVVLKPDAPLVQGRVIDEQGAPLANVTLTLNRIAMGASGEIPGLAPVRTDAGGEFEFHGPCLSFDLQLQAFAPDHRLPRDEQLPLFRCGTSPSFEIRMQLLGRLRGRVLTDPGVGLADLALRVEGPDGVQGARELRRLGQGFAIEFDGLGEGEWRLIASAPRDQQVFASIPGLSVRPGETCRDARLDPLDLRGRIPTAAPEGPSIAIRVLDEQGHELERGFAWCDQGRRAWTGGRVVLPESARGELAVVAPHTGLGRIMLDGQPAEIRLPPALHARFAVELPPDLRASALGLGMRLGLAEWGDPIADELFEGGEWLELNAAGELAIELCAPADLAGSLDARLAPAGRGAALELPLLPSGRWQVRAADGEQRFAIEVRPEAWERVRSALAQRR